MTRDEFVAMACAKAMLPAGSDGVRKEHAEQLVATANVVADRLGSVLKPRPIDMTSEIVELSEELRRAKARIAELEKALDEATMPAPKKKAAGL